jgi:hypothetical protein
VSNGEAVVRERGAALLFALLLTLFAWTSPGTQANAGSRTAGVDQATAHAASSIHSTSSQRAGKAAKTAPFAAVPPRDFFRSPFGTDSSTAVAGFDRISLPSRRAAPYRSRAPPTA